jgi:flagellar basal body-associated protein FliL
MLQSQPPKKSSTGTIIVVVIVVVALVAGLGGYGVYQIYQASPQQNSGGSTTTGPHIVDISGNSLTETVPISANSTVNMSCNYCTVTLQLSASNVKADLDLSGNYNHVTITGGKANVSVSGNYNVVNAQQTMVLSIENTGNGNTIQR